MIPLRLEEIAEIVGGDVHGDPSRLVTGAAYVNSRTPVPAGLFVAIAGEQVDGHDYATGAHAVLGSRPTDAPTVLVADVVEALGRLARHVVDTLDITVLALTGSQGKTGTKDYLATVLATAAPTVATAANNNNELGVPLTVLRATAETRHLVVEMGARGIGHVAHLTRIAPPDVAAVLNVGTAHVGEFGSREAIAQAKGEILESLSERGVAVINADDRLTTALGDRTAAPILTFGERGDVAWRQVSLDHLGRPSFELGYAGLWRPVRLTQSGRHQIANSAAAAAMALASGLTLDDVAAALSSAESASRWRMELTERSDGLLVINDAYNANPESMVAALEALITIGTSQQRRTLAVLGPMLELGEDHQAGHRQVGRAAADLGVDVLLVVNPEGHRSDGQARADAIAQAAFQTDTWVQIAEGRESALDWLRDNADARDVVLVKASRGAALEWLADQLLVLDSRGGTDRR